MAASADPSLLVRLGELLCAIPRNHVVEVLRPLAIASFPDAPPGVMGVSVVRGVSIPVVDGRTLAGAGSGELKRLVVLRTGERHVGLAVESIVGLRTIPETALTELPPLLRDNAVASRLGAMDDQMLIVLDAARLVPDTVFMTAPEWSAA